MDEQVAMTEPARRIPWRRTWPAISGLGVLAIVAVYVSMAYPGHLMAALPYLGLLACPLMHLVMCWGMKGKGSACNKPDDQK